MIDSHAHLSAKDFASDLDAVIARAAEAGVEQFVTISDEIADIEPCRQIAEQYASISFTAGVHPHHASSFQDSDIAVITEALLHPKCVAVGEIGLDYHYMRSPKDTQQRVFEKQLHLAKEQNLPAVVHCRDAVEDLWTIVSHVKPAKMVIHCCTEKWTDVERFVQAGYFLSFTGIATYPKSDDIRETIKECPIEQIMIETDAPFLAPVPHRGKRNEPAFVKEVLDLVSTLKQMSVEEVDRILTRNTMQFFNIKADKE